MAALLVSGGAGGWIFKALVEEVLKRGARAEEELNKKREDLEKKREAREAKRDEKLDGVLAGLQTLNGEVSKLAQRHETQASATDKLRGRIDEDHEPRLEALERFKTETETRLRLEAELRASRPAPQRRRR